MTSLEIRNSKYAAKALVLAPGDVIRVGRCPKMDLVLADDFILSDFHFLLAIGDDHRCHVTDMNSEGGTFIEQERITYSVISNNCSILAGSSEFVLLFESDLNQREIETPITRLVDLLRATDGDLYCLLDAAQDERVLPLLKESGAKFMSLYQGESQRQLPHVAPYLVEFRKDDVFLERLLRHGWGKRWLSLFSSRAGFGDLRKHFRRFLFVQEESGETVYFRYYDPSILRVFLPACNADELRDFFGSVTEFYVEGEMPSEVLRFGLEGDALETSSVSLTAAVSAD